MNQYERIVSYIYQYHGEEKGANVGYAKVEKWGKQCRISVQMRAVSIREVPRVYFYKQMSDRIQTIPAGQMMFRGNSFLWKESCDADKLFGSDWSLEDADGIFIDGADMVYFATTWKNDYFHRGRWNEKSAVIEEIDTEREEDNNTEEEVPSEAEDDKEEGEVQEIEASMDDAVAREGAGTEPSGMAAEAAKQPEEQSSGVPVQDAAQSGYMDSSGTEGGLQEKEQGGNVAGEDLQMQSICGVCPFKRKSFDYGKKILMTFPSMKPFENGVAKACVRMELQDIGCLPIASWSLSGNRFLLHGYYCYRHLLFAQLLNGKYVLGVPGIYSEKERRNAVKFGFSDFQSIGDFGMQQGVFGYWFLELPEGHLS